MSTSATTSPKVPRPPKSLSMVSVLMERATFEKMTSCSRVEASAWSWRANTLTYGLILLGLVIWTSWSVARHNANHDVEKNDRLALTTEAQVALIVQSLEDFKRDTGRYPTTDEGLGVLHSNKGNIRNWAGPYSYGVTHDAWQRPFHYQYPGTHGAYDLYSYGADGLPEGKGKDRDIRNWEVGAEKEKR